MQRQNIFYYSNRITRNDTDVSWKRMKFCCVRQYTQRPKKIMCIAADMISGNDVAKPQKHTAQGNV